MKKLTVFLFLPGYLLFFTLAFCLAAYGGQWTAHGYFYKPSMGASGQAEYNLFNQGLDQGDAELFALDPPPPLLATPPLTYNATTGVLAIPRASATANGYLASADWIAFNAKEPAITPGATSQYWRGDKTWQLLDAGAVKIGEIWVGDPNYGSTIQTAISSINSIIFSPPATLHIPAGTYTFPSSYTIPANITLALEQGAILSWSTGTTLTINGGLEAGAYQIFSCPEADPPVFGAAYGSHSGVKELVPQWWGAKGDDTNDDTIPLQTMVNCSAASGGIPMSLPSGIYKITDTWHVGYGVANLTCLVKGSATHRGSGWTTIIDASAFGDRPAIAVQAGWGLKLQGFQVVGKNVAPATAAYDVPAVGGGAAHPDPVKANYIAAGCQDTQYAPYVGIAVDPYSGPVPTGGYTNDPYGRGSSSGVFLDNVCIQYFVVGLGISPSLNQAEGDDISVRDSIIVGNTYGYSGCGSQNDSINFYNTWVYANWVCFTNTTHGAQSGHVPNIYGGGFENTWKIFEVGSGSNPFAVSGTHAESFTWLGNFGVQWNLDQPVKFSGCRFTLGGETIGFYEPYLFTANSPVEFSSCGFDGQQARTVLNYFNYGPTTFTNCTLYGMLAGSNGFIGINDYINTGQSLLAYQFTNCIEGIVSAAVTPCINNEYLGLAAVARQPIAPWTRTVRLWGNNGFSSYHTNLFSNGFESPALGFSGLSIAGTGHSAVLTFSAANTADWLAGDMILWPVPDRTATVAPRLPAFKVTKVNSGTGVVTAQSLLDNVSTTYAPGNLYCAMPLFINGTTATGNTHSNTTIDNVTNIGNFAVGDWIQGAGIAGARIVNISGTTITLSRNASSSNTGVSIYNCGLTATDMTYPGAGVANSTGSAWGTSYTVGTLANDLVQLNGSGQLPAVSAANLTNFPTLNQNTTGTAANLSGTPTLPSGTTLVAPVLGTPASGNLANCAFPTLNQSTTGAAGSVTGETFPGSGLIVGTTDTQTLSNKSFGSGMIWPTFNQSTTGNAATVTGLTATNGKTLTVSNSLTLAGTDGTTMTFPGSSKTLMAADYSNAGTPPTWNQNTTGTAANVTGTVATANGGTGATANAANGVVVLNSSGQLPAVSGALLTNLPGSSMSYPGAGIPLSTGSAWGASYALGNGANAIPQIDSLGALNLGTQASGNPASLIVNGHTGQGNYLLGLYNDTGLAFSISSTGAVAFFNDVVLGSHNLIVGPSQAIRINQNGIIGIEYQGLIGWSSDGYAYDAYDTSLSRGAAGVLCAGNGTQGDYSGTLKATTLIGNVTGNVSGSAGSVTGETFPGSGLIVGTTDSQTLSNKSFGSGMTWPTFNQNTTGNAATVTTVAVSQGGFGTTTALTPGATVSLNANNGTTFTLTPAQAETINASGGTAGQEIFIVISTSGTTSYTLTFGSGFHAASTLATGTSTGKVFVITFVDVGGTFYEVCRTAAM